MNIEFLAKAQDFRNEQTKYLFFVDGEEWGIVDQNGNLTLVDSDGYPVDDCNDHDGIKDALIPEYEKHLHD